MSKVTIELKEEHGIIWYLGIFAIVLLVIGVFYHFVLDPGARNSITGSMASKLSLNNTSSEFSNLTNSTKDLTNKITDLSNKTKNLTDNIPNSTVGNNTNSIVDRHNRSSEIYRNGRRDEPKK